VFIPYYKIVLYIFIITHLTLLYMISFTKNYPKIANLDGIFETLQQIMTLAKVFFVKHLGKTKWYESMAF